VKIGKGLVGWHLVEVEKWLEGRERVTGRSPESGAVVGNQLGIDSKLPLTLGQEAAMGSGGHDE